MADTNQFASVTYIINCHVPNTNFLMTCQFNVLKYHAITDAAEKLKSVPKIRKLSTESLDLFKKIYFQWVLPGLFPFIYPGSIYCREYSKYNHRQKQTYYTINRKPHKKHN